MSLLLFLLSNKVGVTVQSIPEDIATGISWQDFFFFLWLISVISAFSA